MSEETERALSTLKRRRGVTKASITRLTTLQKDLETDVSQLEIIDHAQRIQQKLNALNTEFRSHHHNIVGFVDSEESLTREQLVLAKHDDLVVKLTVCMKQLITTCLSSNATPHRVASHRFAHIRKAVSDVFVSIVTLTGDSYDTHPLHQY